MCDRVTVTSEAGFGSRTDDLTSGLGEKELLKLDSKSIVRPFVPYFRNFQFKNKNTILPSTTSFKKEMESFRFTSGIGDGGSDFT